MTGTIGFNEGMNFNAILRWHGNIKTPRLQATSYDMSDITLDELEELLTA